MGGWGPVLMVVLVVGSVPQARAQGAVPAPAAACGGDVVGAGSVRSIVDGRSFGLDDGRPVRLAAVEVPPLPALDESGVRAAAGQAARLAFASIVSGQRVELRYRDTTTDRYGRAVAHVYLAVGGRPLNAAQSLLAQGHARVAAEVGDRVYAAEMLAFERAARAAKFGLWGEPYYGVLEAQSGAELLARHGRFALVEGKVLSVRETGGTIYMNFGRRWSDALTVTIWKRNERTFAAAGLPPKSLENRHVRVRGWIEERNGPRIEARHPEQIEIAERN